jgi:hypothetical protein
MVGSLSLFPGPTRPGREATHAQLPMIVIVRHLLVHLLDALPGPKVEPLLGARQQPAAEPSARGGVGGLAAGCLEFSGGGVDGLDGDLVAEAFQAADVVAGLAADVRAAFVVVGAEVGVGGFGSDSRAW